MKASAIFNGTFDTFRLFETLSFDTYGLKIKDHSKTIWQILNHLIIWQDYQLHVLNGEGDDLFNESKSWVDRTTPSNKDELDARILAFNVQLEAICSIVNTLDLNTLNYLKLRVLVDMSSHFSFHLSEIILLARLKKVYPQPEEMKAFLEG